jgi:putative oxidoreductase
MTDIAYLQLILRLALGIGFILPVSDRPGYLGAPGAKGVSWGNWNNFVIYTNSLTPFLNNTFANIAGIIVTTTEIVFGIGLIIGYKTAYMAVGSALLTAIFAISMAMFLGILAPFNYPVLVFTGAAWLLSKTDRFKWSIDDVIMRNKKRSGSA